MLLRQNEIWGIANNAIVSLKAFAKYRRNTIRGGKVGAGIGI
jgi:hypothetical protein